MEQGSAWAIPDGWYGGVNDFGFGYTVHLCFLPPHTGGLEAVGKHGSVLHRVARLLLRLATTVVLCTAACRGEDIDLAGYYEVMDERHFLQGTVAIPWDERVGATVAAELSGRFGRKGLAEKLWRYLDKERRPRLRTHARLTLAALEGAVGELLAARPWRTMSDQGRRQMAALLASASRATPSVLSAAAGTSMDNVLLFALMCKTGYTFGAPVRLLDENRRVPEATARQWREWLASWKVHRPSRRQVGATEKAAIRALWAAGDKESKADAWARYSGARALSLSAFRRLMKWDEKRQAEELAKPGVPKTSIWSRTPYYDPE